MEDDRYDKQNGWIVIHICWNNGVVAVYRTGYFIEGEGPISKSDFNLLSQFSGDMGFIGQRWLREEGKWSDEGFIVINQHAYSNLAVGYQKEMDEGSAPTTNSN